jgi:hypothetical protein
MDRLLKAKLKATPTEEEGGQGLGRMPNDRFPTKTKGSIQRTPPSRLLICGLGSIPPRLTSLRSRLKAEA